jgi:hypothetical protein
MWGFPELPESLKPIVMAAIAIAIVVYLVRSFSK